MLLCVICPRFLLAGFHHRLLRLAFSTMDDSQLGMSSPEPIPSSPEVGGSDRWFDMMASSSAALNDHRLATFSAAAASTDESQDPSKPQAIGPFRADPIVAVPGYERPHYAKRQRYSMWVDPIVNVLSPIFEDRGAQLGNVVCFAGCAGLTTESKPLDLFNVKSQFEYVCDPEPYTYQWRQANGPQSTHHFIDMMAVARDGKGFCYEHGQVCEAKVPERAVHKKLTCGTSCKPFSTARAHRIADGTLMHKDRNLWDAFLLELVRLDTDEAWLENVMGIMMRESKTVATSPLQGMIEELHEKCPEYAIRVFFYARQHFPAFIEASSVCAHLAQPSWRSGCSRSHGRIHQGPFNYIL